MYETQEKVNNGQNKQGNVDLTRSFSSSNFADWS